MGDGADRMTSVGVSIKIEGHRTDGFSSAASGDVDDDNVNSSIRH